MSPGMDALTWEWYECGKIAVRDGCSFPKPDIEGNQEDGTSGSKGTRSPVVSMTCDLDMFRLH